MKGITRQFRSITSGSIMVPTPSTHTSNFYPCSNLDLSSEKSVPSMRHQGPIFAFHPTMLLMTTVCPWISASSRMIEFTMRTPSWILA